MIQILNHLPDYIEEHITEEVNIGDFASKYGTTEHQLKRMFYFITGQSLLGYVRMRKFACANQDIIAGSSITEVAFKYDYQSIEGFSRAFREWCGYLPSEVAKNKIQKTYPKLTFYINIRGGNSMEFRIEKKTSFNLIGVTKKVPVQFEGVNQSIVELAQSITAQQREEMHEMGDLYPQKVLNITDGFSDKWLNEQGYLNHMIGFASSKNNQYSDLEQITVKESDWAIFPVQGEFPKVFQDTMSQIYSEWLPTSNYELMDAPSISFTDFKEGETNLYSEIWLAVKEK